MNMCYSVMVLRLGCCICLVDLRNIFHFHGGCVNYSPGQQNKIMAKKSVTKLSIKPMLSIFCQYVASLSYTRKSLCLIEIPFHFCRAQYHDLQDIWKCLLAFTVNYIHALIQNSSTQWSVQYFGIQMW